MRWIAVTAIGVLWLVLVALVAAGCATIDPHQAAVATAIQLDRKFLQVAELYDDLYRSGRMPEADYRQWARFAGMYKVLSDAAYQSLKAARTQDEIDAAVATLNRLAMELAVFLTYGNHQKEAKP